MQTNFLNKKSFQLEQIAEINFSHFMHDVDDVLAKANKTIPDRLSKIKSKSGLSTDENELLDQIGVDFVIKFMGVVFAIDVTTGKSTVIKNKKRKMMKIKPFLDSIKATAVIVQVRSGYTAKSIIEEIIRSPVCKDTGVIDCRIV